jgi:Relaxase/Mobilisation nuclease domain
VALVIKARSRRSIRYWTGHLTDGAENERVELVEKRGLLSERAGSLLREMAQYARLAPRCRNFLHIASFNPEPGAELTEQQWERAYEIYERQRGIAPGQLRFVVEHEKKGRIHRHVIWLRLDLPTLKAFPDGMPLQVCQAAQQEIEEKLGLKPGRHRVKRGGKVKSWERMRGAKTGIDPHQVEAEVTALRERSEDGQAFKAALEAHGYPLVTGKRGMLILDRAGKEHSLARRCGLPMKDLLAFMRDVDMKALPTVEQGKAQWKARRQAAPEAHQPAPRRPGQPFRDHLRDLTPTIAAQPAPASEAAQPVNGNVRRQHEQPEPRAGPARAEASHEKHGAPVMARGHETGAARPAAAQKPPAVPRPKAGEIAGLWKAAGAAITVPAPQALEPRKKQKEEERQGDMRKHRRKPPRGLNIAGRFEAAANEASTGSDFLTEALAAVMETPVGNFWWRSEARGRDAGPGRPRAQQGNHLSPRR